MQFVDERERERVLCLSKSQGKSGVSCDECCKFLPLALACCIRHSLECFLNNTSETFTFNEVVRYLPLSCPCLFLTTCIYRW